MNDNFPGIRAHEGSPHDNFPGIRGPDGPEDSEFSSSRFTVIGLGLDAP